MTDDAPRPMPGWAKLLLVIAAIGFALLIGFVLLVHRVAEDVDRDLSKEAGPAIEHGTKTLLEGLQSIH